MSQIYSDTSSSPSVPTSFTTDSGTAVPVANNIDILGDYSSNYGNGNGITTVGVGDTVTILLLQRLRGTGSTSGAVTDDVITFSLGGTAGVFIGELKVVGFDSATPSGAGYKVQWTARTDGAAATLVDYDLYPQEEATFMAADVAAVVSGNNVILRVTGVAGLDINWAASGYYERVT